MIIPIVVLLVIGFVVVASGAAPWLIFGFFAFCGFRVVRRSRRRRWAYATSWPSPAPPPVPQTSVSQPVPLARRAAVDLARLPRASRTQVDNVRHKAQWLLQYQQLFPEGSEERYLVEHTLSDYLPSTVAAFLAVPAVYADRQVGPNSKSAVQELKCQLDILEAKLDDLATTVHRHSVDQLRANGRFLEERFAGRRSELDLPVH